MSAHTTSPAANRGKLRLGLRLLAVVILVGSAGYWTASGAHTGWSMNRIPVHQTDDITGIAYVTYQEKFVPGIEWLAGGMALAVMLAALSFFFRSQTPTPTQ